VTAHTLFEKLLAFVAGHRADDISTLIDTNHDHFTSCEFGEITKALDDSALGMKTEGGPSASATAGADGIPRLCENLAALAEFCVMEAGVMDTLVRMLHEETVSSLYSVRFPPRRRRTR
jgi:hypothetical protein